MQNQAADRRIISNNLVQNLVLWSCKSLGAQLSKGFDEKYKIKQRRFKIRLGNLFRINPNAINYHTAVILDKIDNFLQTRGENRQFTEFYEFKYREASESSSYSCSQN